MQTANTTSLKFIFQHVIQWQLRRRKPNSLNQKIFITKSSLRMISRNKKKKCSLLLVFSLVVLLLFTTYKTELGTPATNSREAVNATTRTPNESTQFSTPKQFIYLTQTEQCLPKILNSSKAIGDEKMCNCDVIVLSYRTVCQEEKRPHISYIFVGESSWNLGRNILYFVARERIPGYNYYIFLDDDVDLQFNYFTPQEMKMLTPFRAFEEWLLDYQPAVGVADMPYGQSAPLILEKRRLKCGINETSMVIPTAWFDAMFNAFHHKAIEHILPYPTKYDRQSWWASQLHVICSIELKFRGQAMMFVPITLTNQQHRGYPREAQNFTAQARDFVEEIQNRAPVVYQNRSLFNKLKSSLVHEYRNLEAATYCMNVTRRHPIVPYLHFENESQEK
ncbi:uncharacterized protein LOC144651092 isoform X1 [Oculina patagonica]